MRSGRPRPEHLRPEAASDVLADRADLAGVEPEHAREDHLVRVGRLRRPPVGQPAVVIELGGRGAGLHRSGRQALAPDRVGDHNVAAVEQRLVVLRRAARRGDVRPEIREEQHLLLRGVLDS